MIRLPTAPGLELIRQVRLTVNGKELCAGCGCQCDEGDSLMCEICAISLKIQIDKTTTLTKLFNK